MALKEDLEVEVAQIFSGAWTTTEGRVVPNENSLGLGNVGIKLDATVLYADLSDSTVLVDSYQKEFSAEVYKSFLRCAARIIRADGGTITAYDGDRIMAVFVGDRKNNTAARVGLKINYACMHIVQPALQKQYPKSPFQLKHVVGVDSSQLLVSRAGIRGANDLVWIGKAANHAAKLCSLDHAFPTWITKDVFDNLSVENRFFEGRAMWEHCHWNTMNKADIYRSNWWWGV